MGKDADRKFHLVDTKVGKVSGFDSVENARGALDKWIRLQRGAGEPVVELATGQWKDSKVTVWISGPGEDIVRLKP